MQDNNGAPTGVDTSSVYLLGQIDAKVTHLLASYTTLNERLDKQEERIAQVERGHWKMAGIAAVIPTLLAAAGAFTAFIKGG